MKVGDEAIFLIRGNARGNAVYGSGPYTADSDPHVSTVHAGLLKSGEWGLIRITIVANPDKTRWH